MVEEFFSDFEFQGIVDTTSEINLECLWYCFTKVLQKELDSGKRAVEHTEFESQEMTLYQDVQTRFSSCLTFMVQRIA